MKIDRTPLKHIVLASVAIFIVAFGVRLLSCFAKPDSNPRMRFARHTIDNIILRAGIVLSREAVSLKLV